MKIKLASKLETSNLEKMEISIEFDPNNPVHEGLAAMVSAVCDTVRQLLILQEAVDSGS